MTEYFLGSQVRGELPLALLNQEGGLQVDPQSAVCRFRNGRGEGQLLSMTIFAGLPLQTMAAVLEAAWALYVELMVMQGA